MKILKIVKIAFFVFVVLIACVMILLRVCLEKCPPYTQLTTNRIVIETRDAAVIYSVDANWPDGRHFGLVRCSKKFATRSKSGEKFYAIELRSNDFSDCIDSRFRVFEGSYIFDDVAATVSVFFLVVIICIAVGQLIVPVRWKTNLFRPSDSSE